MLRYTELSRAPSPTPCSRRERAPCHTDVHGAAADVLEGEAHLLELHGLALVEVDLGLAWLRLGLGLG